MLIQRISQALCISMALLATVAYGQAVSGTIVGIVQDQSGASIQNANVTITNEKTNVSQQAITNSSGNYTFPGTPPGEYRVTVEKEGFKKQALEHVVIFVNSTTRADVTVVPGSVSETIDVSAAPAQLQTDRADITTNIEDRQIADLPISGTRNYQQLLNLVPGTTPVRFENSQFFNAVGALQTRVNGIPRHGNLYQIEGIDDTNRTGLLQFIIPPADAIGSVDISTNNYEAELGRATGAVTNVILKSGTNQIHGSAFEFIQNNAVNARSYFGGPLGHLAYNYFGGSLGGPLVHNKLFLFGDYLRTTDREAIANTFTIVPTQFYTPNAQGNIDLSGPLDTAKKTGQIYDPATGNADGTGRQPFVNNQIPISRVNPISLAILQQMPKPNQNLTNLAAPTNNYVINLPFTKDTQSFDLKGDYSLSEKDRLSARYSFQRVTIMQAPAFSSFAGGPAGNGFQGTGVQNSYSTGVNYGHVFSPTLFTETRVGVAHLINRARPTNYGSDDATKLGISGVNISGIPFTSGQIQISLDGFSNPAFGYSKSIPWDRSESNIDFVNSWTKVLHNHTVKFGVDLRRVRDDISQSQTFGGPGTIAFVGNQTSTNVSGAVNNVANTMASFLLDLPSSVGRDIVNPTRYRQWWLFSFISDKWQVAQKLTLDLGLRWEFYPPATPAEAGGFSNYNPTNNTLVLAGIGNNPANLGMKTQYRYFAPRTGFAYRVSEATVFRGGYGISYMPFPDDSYAFNYPVRSNNSYTPVGSTSYTPAVLSNGQVATFQAGFPAPVPVTIPSNGIIPANTSALTQQAYNVVPLDYKNPYVQSWNVAVQQALPWKLSLQLAYVGNHGTRMATQQDMNLPSTYGGGNTSKPLYAPFGRTATTTIITMGFSSNYNALQAQLDRRFSNGIATSTAFTWGKGLGYVPSDDSALLFNVNKRRNYAPNDYDRRLTLVESFTYALPFGSGHRLASSRVSSLVFGGWKLSGIVSLVSGSPFTLTANATSLNTPGTSQTASLVGPYRVLKGIGTGSAWFDPTAFAQPTGCPSSPCTDANVGLGNTGRNQFYGPGYLQNNFSIFKSFPFIRESKIDARLDAFQLSNTPQFSNPNSTYSASSSSTFGKVTSTASSGQGSVNGIGGGRSMQASLKVSF
ncbi:TonB-dependent receptor [Edaphobacter albus]|uniref:TonB-dependent receptor n=1 Tax=Edaphobacter sp. 4G125 TaxID=2763071 RepID=UPI002102BBB4|nr:carboxypeptidase-like regulatory domain-containing protein [Edaphobacter sp. 4G125]